MVAAWKAAGFTYNKYLAIAARAVRRSLKDGPRAKAERRGNVEQLKFVKWENGKPGESKTISSESAAQ
ncbi:mitochondrial ATP synthase epsilon chain domain-containing protein [Ascobolus immersus RN42]|uniref:Mitochondrial ATP synthase epsilon chain domain-containing protein n=1 Tax=Ascobolus immersus RN42 TaxID=1160509 RepID=A0A3N4IAT4_ASCIM|nr:mitochondrial ATP synthase epsilon chain domain-containing protein [Ascobolus immersus RN42]